MLKRPAIWFRGTLLFIMLGGCANQATVVELEDHAINLEKHQLELQRRLEHLEGNSRAPSPHFKSQQILSAGLVAQLSDIELNVREFSGRVDETEHRFTSLDNKVDTESFRTKELLRRIDQLEKRISLLEEGKNPGKQKKSKNGGNTFLSRSPNKSRVPLTPAGAYNLAYNDYLKGNYKVAISAFDAFIKHYPQSVLVPQAFYWTGESYYSDASYGSAVKIFRHVIQKYPESDKVSNALLKVGFAYLELDKPVEGKTFLQKVLNQFPNSNEAPLAEERLAGLE